MLQKIDWQILNYLTLAKDSSFVSQIARDVGVGKSSVSRSLQVFKKFGFIKHVQRGRSIFWEVDRRSPVLAKIRLALNLIEIEPKLTALKKIANKIVLFGSCSKGADTQESDIDFLVVAADKGKVIRLTQNIKFGRRAQWVIKTPQEYIILNNKEPVFAEELADGILLWEAYENTRI